MIWRVMAALLAGVSLSAAQSAPPEPSAPQLEAARPAPAVIPIASFARLPFMESPELSPDGTRIAAQLSIDGKLNFAILTIDDLTKTVLINPGPVDLTSWNWVGNNWVIATLGSIASVEGNDWYISRTVSISADGKKMRMLGAKTAGQSAGDVLWTAKDGSPRILLAMQTSIYAADPGFWPEVRDFDISTGKSTRVVSPATNVFDWYADATGTVRIGISYADQSRAYRLLYRDRRDQQFRTVSRARGPGASLGGLPAMFLPDPGKAIGYDDADGYDALYDLDLTTLKTGNRVFGAPGYDLGSLITDASGTRMIGVRYTDARARTHWFDPVLAKIQTEIDKAVGTRNAQIVSWSSDFATLLVHVGSGDRPGAYYLFRQSDGALRMLAQVNNAFTSGQAPVKTIRYKARDGLEIGAILTLPRGKTAKNLPLILMPHGGPFARDDESWDWWAQFLASRGYAVLQPNYRGSSGFGTAFAEKGQGQWGLAMQDDLADAVKWAADSGLADPKRVCIVGASYGGYAAFRAAQRDAGVYRCAVSYAGVSDMPAMLRHDGGFLNGGRRKDWLRLQAPDLKGVSPINHAAAFAMPILVMHGKADRVVPVKQSREMIEKLKAAGKPYRYVEQPEGDHHFSRQADRVQFLTELEAFLKEHNPA